jgi:hypothetical protein
VNADIINSDKKKVKSDIAEKPKKAKVDSKSDKPEKSKKEKGEKESGKKPGKAEKLAKDPNAPKGAKGGYMFFSAHMRSGRVPLAHQRWRSIAPQS